jgi:hypothetical protein
MILHIHYAYTYAHTLHIYMCMHTHTHIPRLLLHLSSLEWFWSFRPQTSRYSSACWCCWSRCPWLRVRIVCAGLHTTRVREILCVLGHTLHEWESEKVNEIRDAPNSLDLYRYSLTHRQQSLYLRPQRLTAHSLSISQECSVFSRVVECVMLAPGGKMECKRKCFFVWVCVHRWDCKQMLSGLSVARVVCVCVCAPAVPCGCRERVTELLLRVSLWRWSGLWVRGRAYTYTRNLDTYTYTHTHACIWATAVQDEATRRESPMKFSTKHLLLVLFFKVIVPILFLLGTQQCVWCVCAVCVVWQYSCVYVNVCVCSMCVRICISECAFICEWNSIVPIQFARYGRVYVCMCMCMHVYE